MECKHERLKSTNCVISCMDCGKVLPIDYLVAKDRIAAQNKAEETAEEPKEAPKETKKRTRKGGK